jgi:hypothetical protein
MLSYEPAQLDTVRARCDALFEYVRRRHNGYDPAALSHVLAECDALDRVIHRGHAKTKVREVRLTAKRYFGPGSHGFSCEPEKTYFLAEIKGVLEAAEGGR